MSSPRKNFNPSKTLIKLFLIVITVGTLLLKIPAATVQPISLVDAMFTATSAVCVTGLTVKETGTYFTVFGQIIILVLIQIGALGYMALASLIVILLGKGISIKGRLLIQQQLSGTRTIRLSKYVFRILLVTLSMEFFGAVILALRMNKLFDSFIKSVYFGIFHSISAFCNAGFDIFPGNISLSLLRNDPVSIICITLLIIVGGIGYYVIDDIIVFFKSSVKKDRKSKISVHSKIVLTTTLILIILGTVVFFISESNNPATLKNMSFLEKCMVSFFQSVTPRTAGFSIIDTSNLINFSIIFTILLMFIGASPGGTGGGIKTTTIALIFANIKSSIKEEQDVSMFERRLKDSTLRKSVTLFTIAISFIALIVLVITAIENIYIKDILFEVVSAFSTVGLSTGITEGLGKLSKIFIIITMIFGRIGPLTVLSAVFVKNKKITYRYPEQKIAVG